MLKKEYVESMAETAKKEGFVANCSPHSYIASVDKNSRTYYTITGRSEYNKHELVCYDNNLDMETYILYLFQKGRMSKNEGRN